MVEFLKYKETNKILLRNMEAVLKEKASQRSKIFSNYISKDALSINLSNIESFLPWLNQVLKIMEKVGTEIDKDILLEQIRKRLKNQEDYQNTKDMTNLSQVIQFIRSKYMINPRLGQLSLMSLKSLKNPQSLEQSLKNIQQILPKLKLLRSFNLINKLRKGILTSLELRAFTPLRLSLYRNEKTELDEEKRNDLQNCLLDANDDNIITEIRGMKSKIISEGDSFEEIVQ